MNWFKRVKIDFQRWMFLKSRTSEQRRLLKKKQRAIKEADRLCDIDNKRRYVFLLDDKFEIVSTIDVAYINRKLPKGVRWDIVRVMKNCVYHTK